MLPLLREVVEVVPPFEHGVHVPVVKLGDVPVYAAPKESLLHMHRFKPTDPVPVVEELSGHFVHEVESLAAL